MKTPQEQEANGWTGSVEELSQLVAKSAGKLSPEEKLQVRKELDQKLGLKPVKK
jgi:tellurite resistance protein